MNSILLLNIFIITWKCEFNITIEYFHNYSEIFQCCRTRDEVYLCTLNNDCTSYICKRVRGSLCLRWNSTWPPSTTIWTLYIPIGTTAQTRSLQGESWSGNNVESCYQIQDPCYQVSHYFDFECVGIFPRSMEFGHYGVEALGMGSDKLNTKLLSVLSCLKDLFLFGINSPHRPLCVHASLLSLLGNLFSQQVMQSTLV